METTQQQIIDIISDVLYGNFFMADEILPEDCLCSEHGAASIDKVDIVIQVERQFDIALPDDELEGYMGHDGTVQDLINVVQKQMR